MKPELKFYPPRDIIMRLRDNPTAGIYYIRAISEEAIRSISEVLYNEYIGRVLPHPSSDPLIIYVGKAAGKNGLYQRLLQELYHRGAGTFFRSLGGVMGKNPKRATTPSGVRNYRFDSPEKDEIIRFLESFLEVAVVELPYEEIAGIEQNEIVRHCPVFNSFPNPFTSSVVKENRTRCRRYAAEFLDNAKLALVAEKDDE